MAELQRSQIPRGCQRCSENGLQFLEEKEVATHFQLSQSYSLLRAHVARCLERKWDVRKKLRSNQLEEVLVIADNWAVWWDDQGVGRERRCQGSWAWSQIQHLETRLVYQINRWHALEIERTFTYCPASFCDDWCCNDDICVIKKADNTYAIAWQVCLPAW